MKSVIRRSWSQSPGSDVDVFKSVGFDVNTRSRMFFSRVADSCTCDRLCARDISINFCCTWGSSDLGLRVRLLQSIPGQLKSPHGMTCFPFDESLARDSSSFDRSFSLRCGI